MEISLDLEADALYVRFREGDFATNKKVDDETILDYDAEGRLLGIEVLNVSRRIPLEELGDVSLRLPVRGGD